MEIIWKNILFEFHDGYFRQNMGAAMGSKPVPKYTNNCMSSIDRQISSLKKQKKIFFLKRLLDENFSMFNDSTKELHSLFVKIIFIHPTIKLP